MYVEVMKTEKSPNQQMLGTSLTRRPRFASLADENKKISDRIYKMKQNGMVPGSHAPF